jgi:hypothetical protein
MDEEIKKLIEEFVKQIESKEADLVFFRSEIDKIIFRAKSNIKKVSTDLDEKFNAYIISEEEYLKLFREEKEKIIQRTKEKLDSLVQGIEKVSAKREEVAQADEEKIKELRKQLNLPS